MKLKQRDASVEYMPSSTGGSSRGGFSSAALGYLAGLASNGLLGGGGMMPTPPVPGIGGGGMMPSSGMGIMKFAGIPIPDEVPVGEQTYKNLSGRSGVDTYEVAPGGVLKIKFKTGDKVYDYPATSQLVQLADDGIFLNRRLNADKGHW